MNTKFYQPAEDSYFLAEVVKNYILNLKNKDILVLDIGTGSGIQSKNIINLGIKKENITATDINGDAVKEAKRFGVRAIKSDLFDKLNNKQNHKFDLIIFNPPYLSENEYDKKPDTTGGKLGDETIVRFIKHLKNHLEKEGVCFVLTSSLTPEIKWKKEAREQKLKVKKASDKNLFFEKLYVWAIN